MKIRERVFRILMKIMIAVLAIVVAGTVIFVILQISGKNRLYGKNKNLVPNLSMAVNSEAVQGTEEQQAPLEEEDNWQEGDVRYQGGIYRYNEEILTFLFLGIDDMNPVKTKESREGGQSDAIFLLVLDPDQKQISIIAVNRDTMTDIDVYNKQGDYMGTSEGQITLQHAYGDGGAESCERTQKAVSRLFYDLPIHGYCSVNMGAIPVINDTIGGVTLEALEDVPGTKLKTGQEIHLKGMDAYYYLHNRDIRSFDSAGRRLERQQQYLKAYADKAMKQMAQDITLPVKLYTALSKYMVTDVTVDEVSYLAPQLLDYTFDMEHMYSLPGSTIEAEDGFEEFHVDEKGLYELILRVFYQKVDSSQNTVSPQ